MAKTPIKVEIVQRQGIRSVLGAWAPIVISLSALGLALHQGILGDRHQRLSVQPKIGVHEFILTTNPEARWRSSLKLRRDKGLQNFSLSGRGPYIEAQQINHGGRIKKCPHRWGLKSSNAFLFFTSQSDPERDMAGRIIDLKKGKQLN